MKAACTAGAAKAGSDPSVLDEIMFREPGISLDEEAAFFHSIPPKELNPTQAEIDSDDAFWEQHWDEDMSSDEELNREWDEFYELPDAAKELEQQAAQQQAAQQPKQLPKQPQSDKQQPKQAKGSAGGKQRKQVIAQCKQST